TKCIISLWPAAGCVFRRQMLPWFAYVTRFIYAPGLLGAAALGAPRKRKNAARNTLCSLLLLLLLPLLRSSAAQ
ncbi:hypothetical protein JKP88DRAFT_223968, partial [Tribonema minus]